MRHYDEDMIDFPVSDSWRDHYAAQGLTYDSGRYPRPVVRPEPNREADPMQAWADLGHVLKTILHDHDAPPRPRAIPPTDSRDSFEGVE